MSVSNGEAGWFGNPLRVPAVVPNSFVGRGLTEALPALTLQTSDKLTFSLFINKLNSAPILVEHSIIRYGPGIA